jgi:hypothetical protein
MFRIRGFLLILGRSWRVVPLPGDSLDRQIANSDRVNLLLNLRPTAKDVKINLSLRSNLNATWRSTHLSIQRRIHRP